MGFSFRLLKQLFLRTLIHRSAVRRCVTTAFRTHFLFRSQGERLPLPAQAEIGRRTLSTSFPNQDTPVTPNTRALHRGSKMLSRDLAVFCASGAALRLCFGRPIQFFWVLVFEFGRKWYPVVEAGAHERQRIRAGHCWLCSYWFWCSLFVARLWHVILPLPGYLVLNASSPSFLAGWATIWRWRISIFRFRFGFRYFGGKLNFRCGSAVAI